MKFCQKLLVQMMKCRSQLEQRCCSAAICIIFCAISLLYVSVTTCCLAREALEILRKRKDGFDIVISDVNMPDMDGFKLLEYVGLEMDLPVIMMSVDGETSRVMKGIQHGACDYLLKPIRMKELRNIWQHVVRKKKNELRDIEGLKGMEKIQVARSGIPDQSDDGYLFCARDMNFGKKRKGFESKYSDKEFVDLSSVKKSRVVWTVQLHRKFVKTVNHIGLDKIGPKKILDMMNVPWLTRENVASHLQKYRLYLSRLHKEDDLETCFSGIKHSDPSLKEQVANAGSHYISLKKNDADSCTHRISGCTVIQKTYPNNYEAESGGIISFPMFTLIEDNCENKKTSTSEMNLIHNSGATAVNYREEAFCPFIPSPCSWSRNVPGTEIKQECRPQHEMIIDYGHLPYPDVQNQIFSNTLQFVPSIHQAPIREIENLEIKASFSNQDIPKQTPEGVVYELCPVQSDSGISTYLYSEPNTISTRSIKNQLVEHILPSDLNSLTHLTCSNGTGLLPELPNKEFSDSSNLELFTDYSPNLYDGLMFM
ncbi:hypothetical protein AgCh_018163 [Apium graveolens]